MSDIIERAEAAVREANEHPQRPFAAQGHSYFAAVWRAMDFIPELVAELKAARAEADLLKTMVERGYKDRDFAAPCTCGHPNGIHAANLAFCHECRTCPGFNLDRARLNGATHD